VEGCVFDDESADAALSASTGRADNSEPSLAISIGSSSIAVSRRAAEPVASSLVTAKRARSSAPS